jgi:PncC family amidohydrolase
MSVNSDELVSKIQKLFIEKSLTLTVAESCTGGLVAHMITSVPGASAFFDSSLVSYSVDAKKRLLDVKRSTIKNHGVVSEQAAIEMAHGAEILTGADVVVSITGNLGPTAMEDKPIGLVYMAVSSGAESTTRGARFDGDRERVNEQAAEAALRFLYEAVSAWT